MRKVLEVQEKGKEEESRVKVDTDSSPGFIHSSPKVLTNVNIRHVLSDVAIHALILFSSIYRASAKCRTLCEG